MFAIWTAREWNFPTTEDSIFTSNQCEHVNRLAKEQQDWIECPVDVAFHIGRDLQRAKLVEIGRGLMNTGNFQLLPEFRTKDDRGKGEDLLRRIGSSPSYEQIISKYKEERDLTRHAGAGKRREKVDENVEINGEEIDIEEAIFTIEGDDLDTSVELQEVEREFDLHSPHAPPQEISTSWGLASTGSTSRAPPTGSAARSPPTDSVPLAPPTGFEPRAPPTGFATRAPPSGSETRVPPTSSEPLAPSTGFAPLVPPTGSALMAPPAGSPMAPPRGSATMAPPTGSAILAKPAESTSRAPSVGSTSRPLPTIFTSVTPTSGSISSDLPTSSSSLDPPTCSIAMPSPRGRTSLVSPTGSGSLYLPEVASAMHELHGIIHPTGISTSDSTADETLFDEGSKTSLNYHISDEISEVPSQRSEVFDEHYLILENPLDEIEAVDLETSNKSPQRKPFSLVPEYDLTPSPTSSPVEVSRENSCSPMLHLSDSEPDSPEVSSGLSIPDATTLSPSQIIATPKQVLTGSSPEKPEEHSTELNVMEPALVSPAVRLPPVLSTPSSTPVSQGVTLTPHDDIQYVASLDAYLSPGRLFPISVMLKKNLCSQCGSCRPSNWCPHLRNAARKAGLKVKESPVYLKNLTQMRKNQRADKSKSGRKQPRKFDLIPIHEMYNDEESEDILLNLAASNPSLPRSNVDDTIEWVIAQAYALQIPNPDEPGNPIPVAAQSGDRTVQPEQEQVETSEIRNPDTAVSEPLYCLCNGVESGEMIACDNLECSIEWFHFPCVGLKRAPRGKWFCVNCKSENTTKRKLKFDDKNDNSKKRKVEKSKCPKCGHLLSSSYLKTHMKKFCVGFNINEL